MDGVVLARALHVLAVVIWIGGVAMATTVALPAVRRGDLGADRLRAFRAIEHRFAWQARSAVIIVGLTGFYMTARLDLWARFHSGVFWWMHAMVVPVGVVHRHPIRGRAVDPPPALSRMGDGGAGGRLCMAASGALGSPGAQPGHHLRRGRGQPGVVRLLSRREGCPAMDHALCEVEGKNAGMPIAQGEKR